MLTLGTDSDKHVCESLTPMYNQGVAKKKEEKENKWRSGCGRAQLQPLVSTQMCAWTHKVTYKDKSSPSLLLQPCDYQPTIIQLPDSGGQSDTGTILSRGFSSLSTTLGEFFHYVPTYHKLPLRWESNVFCSSLTKFSILLLQSFEWYKYRHNHHTPLIFFLRQ